MAPTPTFSASTSLLKSQLRLSGQPSAGDGNAIFESALLEVKTGFLRELGPDRVVVLKALSFSENPTTTDEALRAIANETELKWVRMVLIRTLPTLFLDASADQNQIYQDEATFRASPAGQLDAERSRLQTDIAENMSLLQATESIGDESSIEISSPQQTAVDPLPGGSLFGRGALGSHFL